MAQQFDIVGNLLLKVDGAEAGLNKLKTSLSQLKLPANLDSGLKKSFSNLDGLFAKYRAQLKDGFNTKGDVTNFAKTGKQIEAEYDRISAAISKVTGKEINLKVDLAAIQNAEKEIEKLVSLKEKLSQNIKGGLGLNDYLKAMQASDVGRRGTKVFDASNMLQTSLGRGDITKAKADVESLISELNRMSEARKKALEVHTGVAFNQIITDLKAKVTDADQAMTKFGRDIETTSNEMAQIETAQLDNATKALADITSQTDSAQSGFKQLNGTAQETADSMFSMTKQVQDLQQSTQYFFSLRNMINLLKRGIDEAVQSVKELDKAMTETAVVTDYKVSDLWGMLPEYTKVANQLGATTQGAYETMTLYYQQGLEQQQAFELGAETMKMARIAGLDYAETTDMMTAALRGFNMELNETSAKRVNDVYSELAAITASDTEELGTAMQRTASIAHSAGMSFEGTTAFLAQAIETTREPAENIGTAMKTIVARFQEMKKNPLEIAEVDGEEVSYNKVDAALQSIGVSLKDTNGQFRELDQVFLDISSRWDSLTQTQQRYIATIAAGSRQQSRFIAMMDDYDRTVQLMEAANNSAGASDEQFGKTMDSLESKLNKLHNAWQEFTMGIANNGMVKLAVDGLTGALNIVNKLIDTFSLGIGPVKSFISVFAAFTGLKAAGRFANAAIGGLGGLIDPQSSMSQGFKQGALGSKQATNAAQAQMIYQPIVAELRAIRQLKGQEISKENRSRIGAYDQYNKLKESRAFLGGLTKGGKAYSLQDIQQSLAGLDAQSQNILMRGNAGTAYNMTNSILSQYYKQLGGDKKAISSIKNAERYLNSQRQAGQLTWEEYFKHISNPELMRAALDKSRAGADVADTMLKGIADEVIKADSKQYLAKEQGRLYGEYAKNGKDITSPSIQKEIAEKAAEAATTKAAEAYKDKSGEASAKNDKFISALDAVGRFGSGISQVGMGIQSFGNILTSSANPALQMFGSILTSVGGMVSGLGMGISAISTGFTTLAGSEAMEAAASWLVTAAKGPEAASSAAVTAAASALTGGLLVLVAVVAGVAFAIKKHNENIKKAAEEVTQNYKDKSSENQSNLANLKQWRSELATLSKGVDKNGLNVSLDTADYDHYLEIVDEIAKINPSIIQGYNEQGHAIIDNNKALEETLSLEQQREKEILKDYTSDESLTKLLKARNLEGQRNAGGGFGTKYVETVPFELKPRTSMRQEISAIGDELRRNKDYIDLSSLDIDLDLLASGSEEEFNKVVNKYDAFRDLVTNSITAAGDNWSDASKEAIEKSFSAYNESASQLDELVQPVYEALSAKASQTAGFKQMENSLKSPFQKALKELATSGDFENNGKAIGEAAKNMATKFASYNDIYLDAMDEVAEANEQFALDLNEQNYEAHTEDAIQSLEDLKKTLEDTPEGHAISEWIDNEIAQIQNHMSGGAKSIEEAWDTISDKVSIAEGALEDFNSKTEKDFSTAADGMQKIYETAMGEDTYHSIGLGDNTFWEAAQKLLGTDNIMDKSMNEVRGMMRDVEPFLKEGPEGVQNFASKVADLSGELEKVEGVAMTSDGWFESIDENVNPEAWREIANILGVSEELLTSMVNKSRQFRQWDFSDMDAVRAAYAADDTVIHGTDKQLFITDSELRDRMGSDYYQKSERENKIGELSAQNIKVLPEHLKDLDTSIMKNEMGINNMTSAIEKFGQTGVFDKTEIQDAAEKLAREEQGKDFNLDKFNEQFNTEWAAYLENMEYPMLQPVQSIEGYVAAIADSITNERIAEGNLTERKSDELEQAIYGERGKIDSLANYFKLGQDASGNQLDAYTYNKSLNELADLQSSGQQYLQSLEEGLGKATGEEQARYLDEISKTKQYLSDLNSAIEAGKQKWEEFNSQETSTESENPKAPETPTSDSTPDPYSNAEKDLYSRNSQILSQWWNEFWKGSTPEGHTELTPQQYQKMYGGSESTDLKNDQATTEAATGLQDASSKLQDGGTQVSNAASKLDGAASKLDGAAANLQNSNNSSNSSIPQGTTIPGVGFVESNVQTTDVNYEVKVANGEEIRASVQEQLASILKSVTSITQQAQASASIKVNYARGKQAKASNQSAKVNYKKGTQEKAEDKEAKVNYVKGSQALPDSPKIATVNYSIGSQEDPKDKTAYVTYKRKPGTLNPDDEQATGSHNHGYAPTPSFGSAAKGYGQVGPKGKGGLTLTGELGYEIAWIPSENRSMILGANGPQMVNLPGDAVVWTHEQSKKILKQKSIPAGSHYGPTTAKTTGGWDFSNGGTQSGGGGGTGTRSSGRGQRGNNNNNNNKTQKEIEKITQRAGKVTVWWENQARKTDAIQRKVDKNLNGFNTLLKNGILTLKELKDTVGKTYISNLHKSTNRSQESYDRATAELDALDYGTSKTKYTTLKKGSKGSGVKTLETFLNKQKGIKLSPNKTFGKDTVSALKKFQKSKGLKQTGKLDKATIDALPKSVRKQFKKTTNKTTIDNGGSWADISYEVTKTKKGKKTKESKKSRVNLNTYIKKQNGVYVLDQKELDKIGKGTKSHYKNTKAGRKAKEKVDKAQAALDKAQKSGNKKEIAKAKKDLAKAKKEGKKYYVKGTKGNKSKAEAIKNAAEAELNKRLDRQKKAEDEMIKNHEAEVDYYNQIEDAFHGWKNELDQVAAITNEIAKTEARISASKSEQELAKTIIDSLDFSGGTSKIGEQLNTQLRKVADSYDKQAEQLETKDAQNEEMQAANSKALKNALNLTRYEEKAAERAKQAENGTTIGSSTVYDALSETEKNAYAKKLLLDNYVQENDDGTHTFNWGQLEKDIADEKITSELGGRLKAAWEPIEEAELKDIELKGEAYSIDTEKIQLAEEEKEYYKQIADQLYGWKNSLTKILELTTKIEQTEKRTSFLKSGQDYYTAKQRVGKGDSSAEVLSTYIGQMASTITQIQDRTKLFEEQKADLQNFISGKDIVDEMARLRGLPQNEATKARLEELSEEGRIRQLAQNYVKTSFNKDGTVSTTFKSADLEKDNGVLFDTETASKIEEYAQEVANKNAELAETMAANVSDITELYTALSDLRQEYADRAKELREAYTNQQQKVIDNLNTLYSAIDSNFKDLISSVRDSIQQRRQSEDNAKTEQDISKKQQRLAMLRADTSGGNKVEIAQLQQEIADAQQAYGRTLEDQLIDKVSKQGDEAAKQRQHQIELMQAQHDISRITGEYAAKINEWLNNPAQHEKEIADTLKNSENWTELTTAEQTVLETGLQNKLTDLNTIPGKIETTEKAINLLGADIKVVETGIENATITALQTATKVVSEGLTTGLTGVSEGLKEIGDALGTKLTATDTAIEQVKTNTEEGLKSLQDQINAIAQSFEDAKIAAEKAKEDAEAAAAEEKKKKEEAERTKKEQAEREKQQQLTAHNNTLQSYSTQLLSAQANLGRARTQKEYINAQNHLRGLQASAQSYTSSHNTLPEEQYANFLFNRGNSVNTGDKYWGKIGKDGIKTAIELGQSLGKSEWQVLYELANTTGPLYGEWEKILKAYIKYKGGSEEAAYKAIHSEYKNGATKSNKREEKWNKVFKDKKYKFKTGGLANFTGPAWLDGTPSKPELVLNATDTQNFLALRDVLSKALSSTNSVTNSYGGDAMYEININVDHLNSDYDVDKVAERVKKIIVKDSSYRNVTQVRNFR